MRYQVKLIMFFISILAFSACNATPQTNCDPEKDYSQIGMDFINLGDYSQAVDAYTCAIEKDSGDSESFYFRGSSYMFVNAWEDAIEDYSTVLNLVDTSSELYDDAIFFKGIAYSKLGQYDNAIEYYTLAIAFHENAGSDNQRVGEIYYIRGGAYESLENFDMAIEDIGIAIQLDPQATYFAGRGFTYSEMNEEELATSDWLMAIELDSNVSQGFRDSATRNLFPNGYEDALQTIEKAILLDDLMGNVNWLNYWILAAAQVETGNPQEAIESANFAFEIAEEVIIEQQPSLLVIRAKAYHQLGQYELALEDIERYMEIDTTNPLAFAVRADVYYELGDFETAFADYTRVTFYNNGQFFDQQMLDRYNEVKTD